MMKILLFKLVSLRAPKGRSNPEGCEEHCFSTKQSITKIASVASLPRNDTFELVCVLSFALCVLSFSGCATAPVTITPASETPQLVENIPGFFHRVKKGQTLWRISKLYNVDIDELTRINKITDTTNVEIGQMILVPNRNAIPKPTITQESINSNNEDFIWPIKGNASSNFGQNWNNMVNKGINIRPSSDTQVVAARSGKVVFCGANINGYGKTIIIEHSDNLSTVYARNQEILVSPGDLVSQGAVIAKAGSVGKDRETYLHFEIRKNHIPQNPHFYLP